MDFNSGGNGGVRCLEILRVDLMRDTEADTTIGTGNHKKHGGAVSCSDHLNQFVEVLAATLGDGVRGKA